MAAFWILPGLVAFPLVLDLLAMLGPSSRHEPARAAEQGRERRLRRLCLIGLVLVLLALALNWAASLAFGRP